MTLHHLYAFFICSVNGVHGKLFRYDLILVLVCVSVCCVYVCIFNIEFLFNLFFVYVHVCVWLSYTEFRI